MRTVHFHWLPLVAAAVLTLAASVAARDRPAGLLNDLEVRQLVAPAEPGDHARLTAHFNALGQTYRGTRIAQAAVDHDRLAGLSRDGAKEATAGAEMHKQRAGVGR